MLLRLAVWKQPRCLVCRMSSKVGDPEIKNVPPKEETPKNVSTGSASTLKIQELLKSMVEANKAREEKNKVKFSTAPGIFKKRKLKTIVEAKEENIEESVTAAATEVAAALGGDVKQTEAELLSRMLGKVTPAPTNLSDLVLGMKIDRTKEPDEGFSVNTRGQQVRRLAERARPSSTRPLPQDYLAQRREPRIVTQASVLDIFNEAPLGILRATSTPNYGTRLETWEKLKQRELSLATAQPPANYFQKMIQWTEQGKVWKFPLDNEQGLEEEANVPFTEHVFLESHLEDWCPKRGPIRHFMELVCVGLSKNPYYTAQEKRDHIQWFKEYFESKKDILAEVGAMDNPSNAKTASTV